MSATNSFRQAYNPARYQFVDLFLDTNPYNAHTIAPDAIWPGCSLLTSSG